MKCAKNPAEYRVIQSLMGYNCIPKINLCYCFDTVQQTGVVDGNDEAVTIFLCRLPGI